MTVRDHTLSFEFYPPRDEERLKNLLKVAGRLERFNPSFYSVTYGAGGSTRDQTFETVAALREAGFGAIPHLSWGSSSESELLDILNRYRAMDVSRIVALRGDVPSGLGLRANIHYAVDLVRFVREKFGDDFQIHVAAYPEVHPDADSLEDDLKHLRTKVDAGANGCITQYFYNADAYRFFVPKCRSEGIHAPIVPGIMPVSNYRQLVKFSDMCGAEIPLWMRNRFDKLTTRNEIVDLGVEVVSSLCAQLLDCGAPGLHFYTMNQSVATSRILDQLGF